MTFILKLLRYNDMIASSLGILSNLFLIFLIFTVNKPNLKQMSYTLLQNCYLDLLLAVVTLISEPQIVVVNGIYYNIVGSYFYTLGYAFSSLIISTYGTSLTLSVIAMPVPFYIRYLVLCKDTTITKSLILKVYGFILGITLLLYCACILCCWPFPSTYEMYAPALQTKFWLDEYIGGPKFCAIHP
uniref:G-protein coupled receptors family 1 profile domain-containing protein n=1 Tax=Panagrolaimus sp. PS1159 TaxID=55785 RepID=A0AC35EXJ0_9BILA